ncbi:MAG: Synerg-CTERM sorting domain-containing protein [Synergistaceae bacterium]|nr:Synerg-CTERM sorting domain-containing protein [Synergistaceae bacterium]
MKRLYSLFMVLALLCTIFSASATAAESSATFKLAPSASSVMRGKTVTVEFKTNFNNLPTEDAGMLHSIASRITFDDSVLEYSKMELGTDSPFKDFRRVGDLAVLENNEIKIITTSEIGETVEQGKDLSTLIVTFIVKPDAAFGETNITLATNSQFKLMGNPSQTYIADIQNATITIVDAPSGSLTLNLTPGTARWSVDEGANWIASGGTHTEKFPTGESVMKTVKFENADGYFTPEDKTYTITVNKNDSASVTYVKKGSVKATLTPALAKWRLEPTDGGSVWRDSGYEYTNLDAGTYTAVYQDITGYTTPSPKVVTVSETDPAIPDNAWDVSVNYGAWGTVTVTITPEEIAANDARWYVDGNSADLYESGHRLSLQGGSHSVHFTKIVGYTTPETREVTVKDAEDTPVNAKYIEQSRLTVTLSPDIVIANGGKWILNNNEYDSGSGILVDAGTYSISFKEVAHFFTPSPMNVTVLAEKPKDETVEYVEKGKITVNLTPITGRWRLNIDEPNEWRGSGTSAEDLDAGTYTVSFIPIDGYATPKDETVTISESAEPGRNTHELSPIYAECGTLTVTITPDEVSGDARWYLTTDSTKQYQSGYTLSINPGEHKIAFNDVSGYTKPADISVTIPAGTSVDKTGEYKKIETGTITVTIQPDAVAADARWHVDGDTNIYQSGQTATVAVGDHTVKFSAVNGYNTPADMQVTVAAGGAEALTATYAAHTSPIEPKLPADTPDDVKAEVKPVKGETENDVTAAAAKLESITTDMLEINNGLVAVKPGSVVGAVANINTLENITADKVLPLPVFTADNVESGKTAMISFQLLGAELKAARPEDVKVIKILGEGSGRLFKYASAITANMDECCTIQNIDGTIHTGAINEGTEYILSLFIKDGGAFDLARTAGTVADPTAIIETKSATPDNGSSGGCSAGLAALALLAFVPMVLRRKK